MSPRPLRLAPLPRGLRDLGARLRARRRPRGEDGFILLESIIAISLITVLMGALATFTLNVLTGTNELRARQGATQLATSTTAMIGAIPATDVITGRDPAGVDDQWSQASATVLPWLRSMTRVSDASARAGAGATATIPTTPVSQTLNGITYAVSTYLGSCALSSRSAAAATDCGVSGSGTTQLRAVVAVTWTGRGCRSDSCTYLTATLVNDDPDPVFNTNRAVPPPKPVVTDPGNQVSTVGGPVTLQLAVDPGTGLNPFTWQVTSGVLPVGLTLAADGSVSGTPTAIAAATPLTVTVTDAFGRTGTDDFTWTVVGPPTVTSPGPQSTVVGQAVSLTPASTCPNRPCSYTLDGAPAGLGINATTGAITGSPTTAGTSPSVTVTATDAAGVATTSTPFTWQVLVPATIGSPGTLRATVGTSATVPVPYTCPAGPCTVTLAGTAPGIGLSTTGGVTTSNTFTTLTLATGSGTVYLTGVPQTTAVPTGTSASYAPTLRIAGSAGAAVTSGPGSWTVFTRPTIGAVGTRNATVGTTKDIAVAYTCPGTPCTITLTGTVPGLGLSATSGRTTTNTTTSLTVTAATGTVWISGLVSASAVPSGTSYAYPLTATITDGAGAATSSSGTWTATTAPKLTNPGSQAVEPYQNVSLPIATSCPNGGCTYAATAQVGIFTYALPISSTGVISYNSAPPGSYVVKVTVTDSERITDTVSFPLTVQTFTLAIANQTTARPTSGVKTTTLDVSTLVRPVADGYVYQLTTAPSWLTVSSDGVLTGTLTTTTTKGSYPVTVKVTSVADPGSTVSSSFTWTVS